MTDAQTIHQFRLTVLAHADAHGNVAATCRLFNVSRKTFYKWRNRAEQYGPDALMPKGRRTPQMPNATPTHVVERLLTYAVNEPTIGARRYVDRLADDGFAISKSTVQKILNDHGLGRRHQRVARAATIAALTTGLVTEPVLHRQPQGRRTVLPADRGRCRDPMGDGLDRGRPGHRRAVHPVPGPRGRHDGQARGRRAGGGHRHSTARSSSRPGSVLGWPPSRSTTAASRHDLRTTTPWWNGSTARCSRSAGGPRSTAAGSPRSASSRPRPTPG